MCSKRKIMKMNWSVLTLKAIVQVDTYVFRAFEECLEPKSKSTKVFVGCKFSRCHILIVLWLVRSLFVGRHTFDILLQNEIIRQCFPKFSSKQSHKKWTNIQKLMDEKLALGNWRKKLNNFFSLISALFQKPLDNFMLIGVIGSSVFPLKY